MDTLEISKSNENFVKEWFGKQGFKGSKLDADTKNKNADWLFSKQNVAIICEVKTIRSGGQWQSHRQVYKEDASNKFYQELSTVLGNDIQIGHLPFDVRISVSGLYIPSKVAREQFLQWLIGFVLWAKQYHQTDQHPFGSSSATFTFEERTLENNLRRPIEANVEVSGPYSEGVLQVLPPPFGAVAYNLDGVRQNIETAIAQIHTSQKVINSPDSLPVVAFWSESSNISAARFAFELIGLKPDEIPHRYNLFDWAFEEYRDLAAIIYFELRDTNPNRDFWELNFDLSTWFPFGIVITNPFRSRSEEILRESLTERCSFIQGISLGESST